MLVQRNTVDGADLAGSVITLALLETLHKKGLISLAEGREILDAAGKSLIPVMQTAEGASAFNIIAELQRGPFSERG